MNVVSKDIVPLGARAGYLEARRLASEKKMRLPSHVLHDDYFVRTERWKEVDEIYPAWALEILAYPEKNGAFAKGKDIIDSETGWVIPARYVPGEAVGKKGTGLLVVPGEIEEDGRVVIHPAEVPAIVRPFIQESGYGGAVDEATRLPLFVPKESLKMFPDNDRRWLHRIDGSGVRPLSRVLYGYGHDGFGGRHVYASYDPALELGVAGESPSVGAPKMREEAGRLIVEGTPEQIAAAARLLEQLK